MNSGHTVGSIVCVEWAAAKSCESLLAGVGTGVVPLELVAAANMDNLLPPVLTGPGG